MKKMLLGLTAVFALTAAAPVFAAEDAEKAKPEKKEKAKKEKKEKAPKEEKK